MAIKNEGAKDQGINGIWAWAGLKPFGEDKPKKETSEDERDPQKGEMPAVDPNKLSADERAVVEVLTDNPMMPASVFYNTLKSKGFKIAAPDGAKPTDQQTQADSATSQPAGILVGQKKIQRQSQIKDNFLKFRFLEGVKSDSLTGASKFRVVLIQEGLGNLKDGFFYTKDALASAVPVFEGAKIYADHPDKMEEQIRPERSVKDVLGHFENVHLEENDSGQAELVGDVCILKDDPYKWARSLMAHAVEYSNKYPDRDFIGLSINASGDANPIEAKALIEKDLPLPIKQKVEKAMGDGVDTIRIVTAIKDAVSCDLVTEAGAGGKVIEMLEGEKNMKQKKETSVDPKQGFEKDAPPAKDGGDMGADHKDHADADQDMELIKKMIAKHMSDEGSDGGDKEESFPPKKDGDGDGDADDKPAQDHKDPHQEAYGMNEQEMEAAMHAYEYMNKKEGMEMPEAAKHAAMHVKCAKAYAEKKHESAKHSEDEAMKHAEAKKEDEAKKEGKGKDESKKESATIAKLMGRIAFLESKDKKAELDRTIDKTLTESKLPRSATKAFKESIGEVKSAEEFSKLFNLFKEAYKAGGEASPVMLDLSIEKQTKTKNEDFSGEAKVGSFSDCIKY